MSAGFAPFKGAESPLVTPGRAARAHRDIAWGAPSGRLASLPSPSHWRVMWDRDTDVPSRLWGPALPAPGATADAAAAEAFARAQLAQHLALLAPGATLSDFALLANTVDQTGLRTVAFAQHYQGMRVVGATVAFTFSHDKLTMISSRALPNVNARMPGASLSLAAVATAARTWLAIDGTKIAIKAHGPRVVMPVVHARGNRARVDIDYRVAESVEAEALAGAGAWQIWIDAADASPIARATKLHFATGTVLYDVPDRYPGGTRSGKPAAGATLTVNGTLTTSGPTGAVTWTGTTAATVVPGLAGPLVDVSNMAGSSATDSLTLSPGGSVTWSKATDEFADAQLISFVAASTAKRFVRERLAPDLAWLDSQLDVYVNEDDICNAYSTGDDIHFYRAGSTSRRPCQNTAPITDVVYHEFGHSVHHHSIVVGNGDVDPALGEGLADTLAAAITGDHSMGRGFFKTNAPLRELDPAKDKIWPQDTTGEEHDDGEIIGQTLWDLRVALEAQYGAEVGFTKFLTLFYGIMQHAADIPTSYAAALLVDDDDGDLSNGTPNTCLIDAAFAAHGLVDLTTTLGLEPPHRSGNDIGITIRPPANPSNCPIPTVTKGTLLWKVQGGQAGATVELAAAGEEWAASIPTQPDGSVIRYQVTLTLSNGSTIAYPQNAADPTYQYYVGPVTTLWCSDFENGIGDWTIGGTRSDWEVGAPLGVGGDPASSHGGANILGTDLGADDGLYTARSGQYVESPVIDLQGNPQVRLQYYRWLAVEDGVYDKATISANDTVVWNNFTSPNDNTAGLSHTDREWRFHDIDLSAQAAAGTMKLRFSLTADGGLELGGWNLDDVCIVSMAAPAPPEEEESGGWCSAGSKPATGILPLLLTVGFLSSSSRRKRRRQVLARVAA